MQKKLSTGSAVQLNNVRGWWQLLCLEQMAFRTVVWEAKSTINRRGQRHKSGPYLSWFSLSAELCWKGTLMSTWSGKIRTVAFEASTAIPKSGILCCSAALWRAARWRRKQRNAKSRGCVTKGSTTLGRRRSSPSLRSVPVQPFSFWIRAEQSRA